MPLTRTPARLRYASVSLLPVGLIAAGAWAQLPPVVAVAIGLGAGLSLSGSV